MVMTVFVGIDPAEITDLSRNLTVNPIRVGSAKLSSVGLPNPGSKRGNPRVVAAAFRGTGFLGVTPYLQERCVIWSSVEGHVIGV